MKIQQSDNLKKTVFCLFLLFFGLMSASVAHAETYTFITKWGSYGSGDGEFMGPSDVAVDFSGNIYVPDTGNNRIQRFDSNGNYLNQWAFCGDIAFDSLDNVYVVEERNNRIQKFDSNGNYLTQWGTFGTGEGEFDRPWYVAVDSSDNIYVVDGQNFRIQKFDSKGNFILKWGSYGTGEGQFMEMRNIVVDSLGNVYTTDTQNSRIQKFDSNGSYLTQWGTFGTGDGEFSSPVGIAVDSSDNIYVAEQINNRIQKFDSNGNFITKWGSIGSADGEFRYPCGVAVDSSGNVYVADTDNNHIQKFALELTSDQKIEQIIEEDDSNSADDGSTVTDIDETINDEDLKSADDGSTVIDSGGYVEYDEKNTEISDNDTTITDTTIIINDDDMTSTDDDTITANNSTIYKDVSIYDDDSKTNITHIETKNINIDNSQNTKVSFKDNSVVNNINFVSKDSGKTKVIVKEVYDKPPVENVYKTFNIWIDNAEVNSNIKDAAVDFKVEKTWLIENNLDSSAIILNMYENNKWVEVPVTIKGEDSQYVYFSAKVSKYSTFAISNNTVTVDKVLKHTGTTTSDPEEEISEPTKNVVIKILEFAIELLEGK